MQLQISMPQLASPKKFNSIPTWRSLRDFKYPVMKITLEFRISFYILHIPDMPRFTRSVVNVSLASPYFDDLTLNFRIQSVNLFL